MAAGGGLTPDVDVLVVGAGPAGLATALQASAHGATVRVVERRTEPFRPSRAMIVHPRTLEGLRPLGVAERVLALGDPAPRAELHLGSRTVPVQLGEVALPDTAYPHLTMVRQADVERALLDALRERGVEVEWGTELLGTELLGTEPSGATTGDGAAARDGAARDGAARDGAARDGAARDGTAKAVLRDGDDEITETTCRFVAGCDGQASTVRSVMGTGWQGGAYRVEVVLADVELDGGLSPGVLHVAAGRHGLVFVFALGEGATWRVLATRPTGGGELPFGQPGPAVPAEEVQALIHDGGLPARLTSLHWSAVVRLQHRLAHSFRQGPHFLVGDAAHTHSPAAAQGMNTGILDALNLGWKLAFAARAVTHGRAPSSLAPLLDSYAAERRPVAREVLALTHLVFFAEASTHPLAALLRGTLVPLAAPAIPVVLRRRLPMAGVVRLLSQQWVRYPHSPLSLDAGRGHRGPRPGDRLPDSDVVCGSERTRLHGLLATPGVHVLLERDAPSPQWAAPAPEPHRSAHAPAPPWVTVHRVDSWVGAGLLAVRPDGHVGLRTPEVADGTLARWLDLVGVRSSPAA